MTKDAKGHGSNAHGAGIAALPQVWTGVGYHGTARAIVGDLQPSVPVTPVGTDMKGIYFSGDQMSAANYASRDQRREGGGRQQVISAQLTMSNPLDITNLIKNGQRRGLSFGDAKRAALTKVTPAHDGVIFKGNGQNPPEYIIFHGSQAKRIK